MKNISHTTTETSNLLRKIATFVVTVVLFGLGLMFSMLLFAVIFTIGVVAWAYLWWKSRALRKQLRTHPPGGVVMEGEVIEGEVIEGEVIRKIVTRDGNS